MNDTKETDQIPQLKPLIDDYREIKAPLGFAERVAAHIKDNAEPRSWFSAKWLYALSFASTAIIAVLIVQQALEIEPELQIAQQVISNQKPNAIVEPAPSGTFRPERDATRNAVNQNRQPQQAARPGGDRDVAQLKEQDVPGGDFNNIAVLSDVSAWLEDEVDDIAAPDFSDLPAYGDVYAMFDNT
jgi:hypothetical protein